VYWNFVSITVCYCITVILLRITVIQYDSQAGQHGGGHWPNDSS
jgi:hypothetical protein